MFARGGRKCLDELFGQGSRILFFPFGEGEDPVGLKVAMLGIGGAHLGRETRAIKPESGGCLDHSRFNLGGGIKRNLHSVTQPARCVVVQVRISKHDTSVTARAGV